MEPTHEQLLAIFNSSPKAIQDSLTEGPAIDFILKVADRYKLHVDVAGQATGFIRNMLLGVLKPDEFIGKLQSVGITESVARQLTADLNSEVFVPLRDEIRKSGGTAPNPQPSTLAQVPVMKVGSVETTPISPAQTSPTGQVTRATEEAPAYNLIRPESPVPPPTEVVSIPAPRTMASDVQALTHPEQSPAQAMSVSPQTVPHPWQASPAQSFQTASVPYTSMPMQARAIPAPPVVQLPNEWKSAPIHTEAIPIVRSEPSSPTPNKSFPPLTKEYGSDPYREPIA